MVRMNLYLFFAERGYKPKQALDIFRPHYTEAQKKMMMGIFTSHARASILKEWDLIKRAIRRTDKENANKTKTKNKGKTNR